MEHVWLTVFGISFIFITSTLGAAVVFLFKKEISAKANTIFLGFASGVMLAASVWSLLIPAINQAKETLGAFSFLPAAGGIMLGGLFLVLLDKALPKTSNKGEKQNLIQESEKTRARHLFLAITLHNIPEGLAVGFAFGAAAVLGTTAAYLSALGVAIGIGIQNFPEGAAISLPMKAALKNDKKAFLYGVASALVEPLAASLGYFLAKSLQIFQPWLLSFAAGAMLFVAVEDLIPDSKLKTCPYLGAWGALFGFVAMMILDVALG